MSVEHLFGGADLRCEELVQALKTVIYERGIGIPVPAILGTIEILKHEIIKEQS